MRPPGRSHQAGNRIQRRGLACAVRAEQRDDGACLHVQRHVGDADQIAVAHFQVLDARLLMSSAPGAVAAAKIGLDHGLVLDHVVRLAAGDHVTLVEHEDTRWSAS